MILELGNLRLAPRPRYAIEGLQFNPTLNSNASSSCATGCSGVIKNWDIQFTLHFLGNGSIAAARNSYKAFEDFVNALCPSNTQKFSFQACEDFDEQAYYISSGYIKPTNIDWLLDPINDECCVNTTISAEVHLTSIDANTGVEVMMYNYLVGKPLG